MREYASSRQAHGFDRRRREDTSPSAGITPVLQGTAPPDSHLIGYGYREPTGLIFVARYLGCRRLGAGARGSKQLKTPAVVLVVEDDALLQMAALDMVKNAGFKAVAAANATEAIRILEARLDVRIVFSDIDMPPGIDGIKLAALIRDRWPPIEIILVSGHISPPKINLPARAIFFSKPYRESEVICAMRNFIV